jgi:hypothetical protein
MWRTAAMPPHVAVHLSEAPAIDTFAKPIFDIGDALSLNVSEDYFAPPAMKRCFASRDEADAYLAGAN